MKKEDRVKSIVAGILVTSTLLSFIILGKDSEITRWLTVGSLLIWVVVMVLLNKKKK